MIVLKAAQEKLLNALQAVSGIVERRQQILQARLLGTPGRVVGEEDEG